MFKISPIQDADTQKMFAKECGCTYRAGAFAYSMTDNETGEIMGFSQFEIENESGFIYDLKTRIGYTDNEALFILGRATMNFIDLCGIHKCRCAKNAGDEKILHAIGFKTTDNDAFFCDMTGMFDGHCDGKTAKLD